MRGIHDSVVRGFWRVMAFDGFGADAFVCVPDKMIVEELASIVAIEAEDGEREGFFDVFDLFQYYCFTFAPYGPLFGPAGGDIDEIDGIGVHIESGVAAMSDRIGFRGSPA